MGGLGFTKQLTSFEVLDIGFKEINLFKHQFTISIIEREFISFLERQIGIFNLLADIIILNASNSLNKLSLVFRLESVFPLLVNSAGVSFTGLGLLEGDLGISQIILIANLGSLGESHRGAKLSVTIRTRGGRTRSRGSRTRSTGDTGASGRGTVNSHGGNTSTTPTSRSSRGIIVRILTIELIDIVLILRGHLFKSIFLLESHGLLLILPLATSGNTSEKSTSKTRTSRLSSRTKERFSKITGEFCKCSHSFSVKGGDVLPHSAIYI